MSCSIRIVRKAVHFFLPGVDTKYSITYKYATCRQFDYHSCIEVTNAISDSSRTESSGPQLLWRWLKVVVFRIGYSSPIYLRAVI